MSDRRPENPSEKIARLLAKDDADIALDDALGLLIEVQRVLDDPVAVVRRGVESGTIKGSVANIGYTPGDADGEFVEFRAGRYLIIPVSDGGSET